MTREQFVDFLEAHDACSQAKDWVAAHPDMTPAQLWEACLTWEYLVWLLEAVGVLNKTKYYAKTDPIRVECNAKLAPIRAERDAKRDQLRAECYSTEYDAETRAEYCDAMNLLLAEYAARMDPVREEYYIKEAAAVRSLVPWEQVEAAITWRVYKV